ncbi:hypothetical protein MLD38_031723 [Melastoma candidum]|uniref:Uncharacterized protein n=1 Tax=Melastoma candidum TaxID=119954 RepID=A0ACB9MS19_9MYRT|nr:hypothetical protein MLD38_031723 [Melastoma candidum]
MNGLQSRKDCRSEKPFPGCLGGMVSLFDLSAAGHGRKLLADKPHFGGLTLPRIHQDDGMMPETPDQTEIEDKMIISESRRSSPRKSPNCTPMKMLIAQEMSKETRSEDGPPNVVAKLMGLDALPSRQPSPDHTRSKSKGYAQSYGKSTLKWMEERTYSERQTRNNDCRLQKQNDCKDVHEVQKTSRGPSSIKGMSIPRGRNDETIRDDKMAFVRQKFLEAKRLATSEKLLKSKEFQDAVDVLSSNTDVFLKLLQEPNTKLSKNLNELPSFCGPSMSKRITVLRPSKVAANNRFYSTTSRNEEPENEQEVLTREAACTRSFPVNFSPTNIRKNHDHCPSQQPTRIVVLKPSFRQPDDLIPGASPAVVSGPLIQSDFIHVDDDTDARTSREIAREVTHYTRETLLHQRRDESLLSPAMPNGYGGNCGSPFTKLNDAKEEDFSDPEVTSPASRRSWDVLNSFDSPFSTSSLSRGSYSPDSSVCREAKKRLSERWAVMASNGKCQEVRHLRKSSSTLGEMLALSDSKILSEKQEQHECKADEPRMSASCLKTGLSGEEFAESLKCLSRSKSVPLSSTLSGDRMHLRPRNPDSSQRDGKVFAKDKDSAESSAYIVDSVLQSSSLRGKNCQEDDSLSHCQDGALGKKFSVTVDDLSLRGRAIAERSGPCISRSPVIGANQDQPSPVSVLDPTFEDDSSITAKSSGKELPTSSHRCNLIDKSPPIGSISRTLSGNYFRKSEPPCAPKPSLIYSCAKEEEQELPSYIRRLLSTVVISPQEDPTSTDISRWHSPYSPLDPTLRNKCTEEEDNEDDQPLHEARKRLRRSNRKLVFDCVNTALLRNAGLGPGGLYLISSLHGKVDNGGIQEGPSIMGDRVWGQIKDWFSSEFNGSGIYDEDGDIMVVDTVIRYEVVGKGWIDSFRLEVEHLAREIVGVVLQELVYETLVDLTENRGNEAGSVHNAFSKCLGQLMSFLDAKRVVIGSEPTIPYLNPELTGENLLIGANFASAGTGILNDMGLTIIRIHQQFKYFQEYQQRLAELIGEEQAQKRVNNALVLITLGGNDFVNNYFLNPPLTTRRQQFTLPRCKY